MLPRIFKITLLSVCVAFAAGNTNTTQNTPQQNYYCPVTQQYKDYQAGKIKLEALPSFSSQSACEATCTSPRNCEFASAKVTNVQIATIKQGKDAKINIDEINKKIASVGNIVSLQIKVDDVPQFQLSDKTPFTITELFKPITESLIQKEGFVATVNGNTAKVVDIKTGDVYWEVTTNSAMIQKPNGTLSAQHAMCQREEKIPQAEYQALLQQYAQALKDYQDKKIPTKPTVPSDKKIVDYQCTKINDQGKSSTKDGWINLAQAIGVTFSASSVELKIPEGDESGNFNGKYQTYNIPITNGRGEYIFSIEAFTSNEVSVAGKKLFFEVLANNEKDLTDLLLSVSDSADTNDKDGARVEGTFEISVTTENSPSGYRCPFNNTITGDLGINAFSTEKACYNACLVPSTCITINTNTNNGNDLCKIISTEFLNPITDINQKTIYLSRKVIKECSIQTQKQVGCGQYETKTSNSPNLDEILKGGIPVVQTNKQNHDFSKATEVFGVTAMAENMPHIFGAEASYCDSGQFIDKFDPWKLLNYAFMIAGPVFDSLGDGAKAFDTTFDATKEAGKGTMSALVAGTKATAKAALKDFMDDIAASFGKDLVKQVLKNVAIYVAAEVAEQTWKAVCDNNPNGNLCPEQEQKTATQLDSIFNSGNTSIVTDEELDGALSPDDKIAVEYVTCMSQRFQLTVQDINNYNLGLEEVPVLHYAYLTPVRLNPTEIGWMVVAMTNKDASSVEEEGKYFYSRYKVERLSGSTCDEVNKNSKGGECYDIWAMKGEDYYIAAEIVCKGEDLLPAIRVKYGDRFLDPKLANPTVDSEYPPEDELKTVEEPLPGFSEDSDTASSSGESLGEQVTGAVVDAVLGSLPFPANLGATFLKDMLELFEDRGNTCTDMELAEKRAQKEGDNTYITTNKRISLGLCTKVATEERSKIGGTPIRKRHHYCCFDQVTTRVMAEGSMVQLGKKMTKENCAPLTVDDLANVSFRACKTGEDPNKNSCFPTQKFQELTDAFMSGASIGIEEAVEGIVNSVLNLTQELH